MMKGAYASDQFDPTKLTNHTLQLAFTGKLLAYSGLWVPSIL